MQKTSSKKTVIVGMSGGVDSSVAAALLAEQGFNVIGLFMHNWEEQEQSGNCTAETDFADAKNVCSTLKIPCYSVNFSKEYWDKVFSHFLAEYKAGRTPNPDVLCNREIKFGDFANFAKKFDADYIATGHYCDILNTGGTVHLLKAADQNKDQTYFLNQVRAEQLKNVLFPLGKLKKDSVREIATKYGFITAKKKDSTGICFVGERNFRQFLSQYLPAKAGDIVDKQGNILGRHMGLMYYTLGQRRGLGIGGVKGAEAGRWYVFKKDLDNNRLVLSSGDEEELYSGGLIASGFNWIDFDLKIGDKLKCNAKFRYRQAEQGVTIEKLNEKGVKVLFDKRQKAITPGQYVVLYLENRCLGGGVIDKVID